MAKVTMPQLGESVAEGTIGKWLKQVGDDVAKYEPLLEVITDKVNAEVPSPVAGVLTKILVQEGETVPNNAEIAIIEEAGAAEADPPRRSRRRAAPAATSSPGAAAATAAPPVAAAPRCRPGPRPGRFGRATHPRARDAGHGRADGRRLERARCRAIRTRG